MIGGRPHKLSVTQFQELRLEMLKRPEMSYRELSDLVWARFRVRYSRARLRHLLKAKLGIEWKPARSDAGTAKPAPRTRVAQPLKLTVRQGAATHTKNRRGRPRKLNAAQLKELRDYVLERPETSFWRLHRLVWNRFHVRHSHASLKRLLKTEFGIAWTGASKKLGEGLNLAELQPALASATDWRMKKRLKALIEVAKGAKRAWRRCRGKIEAAGTGSSRPAAKTRGTRRE
jgi:transposase